MALTVLLGSVMLATPAAAQEGPSNFVRGGPNLTLTLANCDRSADTAVALELARHSRNAAAACLSADGVPEELAALIAAYAPDHVMIVGGPAAVPPAVMEELTAAVRSAFRWTIVQHFNGATRVETAAAAARIVLDKPVRVGADTVTFVVADGWNEADVNTAYEFAATLDDAAVLFHSPATATSGWSDAVSSLIADYRPARIVFAGLPDEEGIAAEAATEAVLDAIEGTQSSPGEASAEGEPALPEHPSEESV